MPDRLQASLRLKAARHLAGRLGDNGKRAIPLPVNELAASEILRLNGITANRLEEIEQMKTDARPMELEKIALALNVAPDWFVTEREAASLRAYEAFRQALADAGLAPGPSSEAGAPGEGGEGPSGRAAGGGGA